MKREHLVKTVLSLVLLSLFNPVSLFAQEQQQLVGFSQDQLNQTDVATFLETIKKDYNRSNKKKRFPNTGYLEIGKTFAVKHTRNMMTFEMKTSTKKGRNDYAGKGKLLVEIFADDDFILLLGKEGLPSMRADVKGNFLLTKESRQRLLNRTEKIRQHYIELAGGDEAEARAKMSPQFQKLEILRTDIVENYTMFPQEISRFLHRLQQLARLSNQ